MYIRLICLTLTAKLCNVWAVLPKLLHLPLRISYLISFMYIIPHIDLNNVSCKDISCVKDNDTGALEVFYKIKLKLVFIHFILLFKKCLW